MVLIIYVLSCTYSPCVQAASKSSLRNHLTDSHEDLCYKCKKCVYKSTTYGALARHMRSVHKVRRKILHSCVVDLDPVGSVNYKPSCIWILDT